MKFLNVVKTFAFALVAATAIMGFSKTTHAYTTTVTGEQTTYKNMFYNEAVKFIEEKKSQGTLLTYGPNNFVIKQGDKTYNYTLTMKNIELTVDYSSDITENAFDTEQEAKDFIEKAGITDGEVGHFDQYCSEIFYHNEFYYVKGTLCVCDITVAPYQSNCTSLKITADKTYMYAKDGAVITVEDMVGGEYTDLEWSCLDPNVVLNPDGQYCYVTSDEAVGTVMIKATAPSGVFAYVHISIM